MVAAPPLISDPQSPCPLFYCNVFLQFWVEGWNFHWSVSHVSMQQVLHSMLSMFLLFSSAFLFGTHAREAAHWSLYGSGLLWDRQHPYQRGCPSVHPSHQFPGYQSSADSVQSWQNTFHLLTGPKASHPWLCVGSHKDKEVCYKAEFSSFSWSSFQKWFPVNFTIESKNLIMTYQELCGLAPAYLSDITFAICSLLSLFT